MFAFLTSVTLDCSHIMLVFKGGVGCCEGFQANLTGSVSFT